MNEKTCKDCAHYIQHYTINQAMVRAVACGKCTRRKKIPDEICGHFVQKAEEEVDFVKVLERMAKQINDIALIIKYKQQ